MTVKKWASMAVVLMSASPTKAHVTKAVRKEHQRKAEVQYPFRFVPSLPLWNLKSITLKKVFEKKKVSLMQEQMKHNPSTRRGGGKTTYFQEEFNKYLAHTQGEGKGEDAE